MDISFVLLTWNSEKYIGQCLDSLFVDLTGNPFSYEIFIVDNGSKDNTVQIINSIRDKYPEKIIPIFLKKNTGTTYPRNLALKRTKGEFVFIMDSDIEVSHGSIEHLINSIRQNKKAGIVAPRLLYPNGRIQRSTDVFPTVLTKIFRYLFLKIVEKKQYVLQTNNNPKEVDYAISALWILRHEILEKIGFLDENIFYAPEDVDYCLRVWKAGYKILYDPTVSFVHHAQEISRGTKINTATLRHINGLLYYFWKHKYLFKKPVHST